MWVVDVVRSCVGTTNVDLKILLCLCAQKKKAGMNENGSLKLGTDYDLLEELNMSLPANATYSQRVQKSQST